MSSTSKEILNDKLRKEFDLTYTENDLLTRYCEEHNIILTPETLDSYSEDHFTEFRELMFEEYKELRGY